MEERREHVNRLYQLLYQVKERTGFHTLENAVGGMDWPTQGVYFFFHPEETRENSEQLRVTRVGTHAVSTGSKTKLWDRLRQHRGPNTGEYGNGGNHRGSVFRLHVGDALIQKHGWKEEYPEWGTGSHADEKTREEEHGLEQKASAFIRKLKFLCLPVPGEPGPDNKRARIERNSIALLSNYGKTSIDPRNSDWLGAHSPVEDIRASGLWNVEHVEDVYDPEFLDVVENCIND